MTPNRWHVFIWIMAGMLSHSLLRGRLERCSSRVSKLFESSRKEMQDIAKMIYINRMRFSVRKFGMTKGRDLLFRDDNGATLTWH
jgi:hypothetical protein